MSSTMGSLKARFFVNIAFNIKLNIKKLEDSDSVCYTSGLGNEDKIICRTAYINDQAEDRVGLLSRSTSFVRYTVDGRLPENFWEFAAEQISRFSFQDIDDTFDEYSIGWVAIDNMFDSTFAEASYAIGDQIVLALRIDERKVSTTLLRKYSLKEEERVKKEHRAPRLSRGHRQQIKEEVRLQLTKKAMPVPAVYDLSWNLADNTLLFFTTSVKAQSVLEDFFKECFGFTILLQVPYLTAAHLLGAGEQDRLKELRAELFI